jgi:hypothetical protein
MIMENDNEKVIHEMKDAIDLHFISSIIRYYPT